MRRIKAVPISFDLLSHLIEDGYEIGKKHSISTISPIPQGSKIVSSFTDNLKQTGYIILSHESFDEVPTGGKIPIAEPIITKQETPDPTLVRYIQRIYDMNNDEKFRELWFDPIAKRTYFLQKITDELQAEIKQTTE